MEPVLIQKFIPGGQTLGELPDGRKIFFWGALPGETAISYSITKQKSHYLEAIATEVAHPSPHRIAPLDPCYLSTSPWQILSYPYELSTKRELIIEQFRQAGLTLALSDADCQTPTSALPTTDCQPLPPLLTDSRDFHYRNKMEYALYYSHEDEQIHLAFHARGSHRKIPVEQSNIERPELWQAATRIVRELNAKQADSRRYQSLLLRCNQQGEVSGGLFENHRPHPVFPELKDSLLGHEYSYSPNGFFQINLPVYEMALRAIAAEIETTRVLDLYSGVGSIGLSVAPDSELTLVECDAAAYGELRQNAQRVFSGELTRFEDGKCISLTLANGMTFSGLKSSPENALKRSVALAKSEDALDFIAPNQTVILDPPRAGCHAKLLERLLEVTPLKIIYLSCNPATQARDLQLLQPKYRITKVQPFNFFPRTPHIENLVVLSAR